MAGPANDVGPGGGDKLFRIGGGVREAGLRRAPGVGQHGVAGPGLAVVERFEMQSPSAE